MLRNVRRGVFTKVSHAVTTYSYAATKGFVVVASDRPVVYIRAMPHRRSLLAILAIAALLSSASAEAAGRRRSAAFPQSELQIFPLAGYSPSIASTDDLEPLRSVIGDARVVALGEGYHTSAGFYLMKDRVFRFLVEEMGFRAFAIESYWEGAEYANRYVQTCAGSPEDAISRHINVWQSTEYAGMVEWMCQWNRAHPRPEDKVNLFGFDIQQPWSDGEKLARFLEDIGIRRPDARQEGIRLCEGAFGLYHPFGEIPADVHARCVDALNAIEDHLEKNRADVLRQVPEDDLTVAMLRVVGLRAWQESVYIIKHDFPAGFNPRDEAMAYAFHVQRARIAPNAKTMVWAANMHVAKNALVTGELPLGSYLARDLGEDYLAFALVAFESEIDFPGYPCGLQEREANSVEERLGAFGHDALLATFTENAPRGAVMPMSTVLVRPYDDYDGIIWLRHSPRMHPLVWAPCR